MTKKARIACRVGIGLWLPKIVITAGKMNNRFNAICINEVCSWNRYSISDDVHNCDDYIELYNRSEENISLENLYLSDDKDDLKKGTLPKKVLAPGERILLYANGTSSEDSIAFCVSRKGEMLFLSDENGNLIDYVKVPALEANTVYARIMDGASQWGHCLPTPGISNNNAQKVRDQVLEKPHFSEESGFYEASFFLTMSARRGETIYYTMDGSVPTIKSCIYTEPIEIRDRTKESNVCNAVQNVVENWKEYTPDQTEVDKAMVVRAIAVDEDGNYSDVKTATYFIGLDQYKDRDVLCLTADPEDLFGDEGIHVTGAAYDEWYLSGMEGEAPTPNYKKSGRGWEIEGNLILLEKGEETLQQSVGLRIQGESSRKVAKKHFSIFSRPEYSGSNRFDGELLAGKSSHSIMLLNNCSDSIVQSLSTDRSVGYLSSREVEVFLNGEYWYTAQIRDKYNKYFLSDQYHVDQDNIILMKGHSVAAGEESDYEVWEELFRWWPDTDKTDAENYEELSESVDIQSLVDFLCINIYMCNMDVNKNQNHVMWRTREDDGTIYGDGRWRWLLYDMDSITWNNPEDYDCTSIAQINTFSQVMTSIGQALNEYPLFRALKHNEIFRKQFVLTFMDLANTNYSPEAVSEKLNEWGEDLTWNDEFFLHRFEYIVPYMAEEFHLAGTLEDVTLEINDSEAGSIQLNTCIPNLSGGSWTGKYYTDYPVTVIAVANSGYYFVGWEGSLESAEDSLTVDMETGGIYLKAIFEKE